MKRLSAMQALLPLAQWNLCPAIILSWPEAHFRRASKRLRFTIPFWHKIPGAW